MDRDAVNARWWHGGDPVGTAFFNALSVTFPQGEAFFIKFLLIEPGMVRRILRPYLDFYRPGFHPWTHDRALIAAAEKHMAADVAQVDYRSELRGPGLGSPLGPRRRWFRSRIASSEITYIRPHGPGADLSRGSLPECGKTAAVNCSDPPARTFIRKAEAPSCIVGRNHKCLRP